MKDIRLLIQGTMTLISDNACRNAYGNLAETILCATAAGSNVCNGDSGGFLGNKWVVKHGGEPLIVLGIRLETSSMLLTSKTKYVWHVRLLYAIIMRQKSSLFSQTGQPLRAIRYYVIRLEPGLRQRSPRRIHGGQLQGVQGGVGHSQQFVKLSTMDMNNK